MGSKIINFKDLKVEHPNRYKVTDSNGTEDIKKIDFDPGLIYQAGTPESAENFNNIQKNCIYEVSGVRILEGQEEIYDISIDGFNNFEFENLKILMTPNTTNTIKGSFIRLDGAKYIIKNRTDSIGVGQIFSGESIFISLHFARKTADVIATLNGGYVGTLKELALEKVSKAGDTMTGTLKAPSVEVNNLEIRRHPTPHIDFTATSNESMDYSHRIISSEDTLNFLGASGFNFFGFNGQITALKFIGPVQGNSDTSTKLLNGRNITIGNKKVIFDGSTDVSFEISEIGAISKSGDTMTGSYILNGSLTTGNIEMKGSLPHIDFGLSNEADDYENRLIRNASNKTLDFVSTTKSSALNIKFPTSGSFVMAHGTKNHGIYIDDRIVGFYDKEASKHGLYFNPDEDVVVVDTPISSSKKATFPSAEIGQLEINGGTAYVDVTTSASQDDYGIRLIQYSSKEVQMLTYNGDLRTNLKRLFLNDGSDAIARIANLETIRTNSFGHAGSLSPNTNPFDTSVLGTGRFLCIVNIRGQSANSFTQTTITLILNNSPANDYSVDRVIEAGTTVHPISVFVGGSVNTITVSCPTGVLTDLKVSGISWFKI